MDLRAVVCVVLAVIVVEARSPPRPQCLMYCPNGFVPGEICRCNPPHGGDGTRPSPCDFKVCNRLSRCVERYGRAVCVPRFPIYPYKPSGGSNNRVCYQPKVVGFCKAAFPRYYYNRTSRRCERFTYGGCGGNDNSFRTLQQCRRTCERRRPRY